MPGDNGGELAGMLGEMLRGGLEAMAAGREGRPVGREVLGQMAAQRM